MAVRDNIQLGTTTHANSVTAFEGNGGYSGVGNSTQGWDQDPDTYTDVTSGKPNSGLSFSQTHTFVSARTINQFRYKVVAYANIGSTTYGGSTKVEIKFEYYDGTWKILASSSDTGGSPSTVTETLDATTSGTYSSVTKVRITASAYTKHSGGEDDSGSCYGRIYDCRALSTVDTSYAGVT